MLDKLNADFKYYRVVPTTECIREDGNYQKNRDDTPCGYAVVNHVTGVIEVTSMNLANAVFNAEYLDKSLQSMLDKEEQVEIDYEAAAGALM